MFGYIRTVRGELRVREYEYYRATYCGLCRSMGKCTGQCSRMLLSFDFAFLATVRMALTGEKAVLRRRRCLVHPLRPRVMMEGNKQLDFCAVASTLLAFEKCRDDVADERGIARLKARLQCLWLLPAKHRATRREPVLSECVRGHLSRLSSMEKRKEDSVDTVAAVFGDLLADVASHGLSGEAATLARSIGRETGRFIYILDAIDDLEKDAKRGRYNPFLLRYGGELDKDAREGIRDALFLLLGRLEAAMQLLPDGADATQCEILKNILYLGMKNAMERALSEKVEKEDESEQKSL